VSRHVAATGIALWVIFSSVESFAVGAAEEQHACMADVFRLCSSQIPNVDRIVACMQSKKADLSIACRAVFDQPAVQPARTLRETAPSYQ
jgi:hypothetical protein